VCPIGVGVQRAWSRVLAGGTGVRALLPEDLPEVAVCLPDIRQSIHVIHIGNQFAIMVQEGSCTNAKNAHL
jgi:hypothetical protein